MRRLPLFLLPLDDEVDRALALDLSLVLEADELDREALDVVAVGLRELDRRIRVVALADADADRLARLPLLLLLPLEALSLPRLRRQHAFDFARDVDAGAAAETELAHEARDGVDAEVVGEHGVVGVARGDDRRVHIDREVPALLVVVAGQRADGPAPGNEFL